MPSIPSPSSSAPGTGPASRLRLALLSNLADAAGVQLLTLTIDLLAVAVLGFTPTQVGLLNALGTISYLLLAVPLGAAVDARGPVRALMSSLAVKALLALVTLALLVTHHLGVWNAMAVSLVFGVASVATETAQTSLVAHLTHETHRITDTVSRMASADRAAAIVCPGIVGLAVAHQLGSGLVAAGLALLLLALAALARLVSASAAGGSVGRSDPATRAPAGSPGPVLLHGFRVLVADRTLLAVTLLITAGNIGLAIGDSVETILVVRRLQLGSAFFGMLGTISAAAGLCATLLAPRLVRGRPLKRLFALGGVAQAGVAALPLAALEAPAQARLLLVAFSISWAAVVTVCNIAGASYTAAAVPRESLGRTSAAARTLTMGSVPLAAFVGGFSADRLGLAAPLVAWPVLTAVAATCFRILARDVPAST